MKTTRLMAIGLLLCLSMQIFSFADIQVVDPGYKTEVWLNLTNSYVGEIRDMVFDSSDNLYLTTRWAGSVTKITSNKQVNTSWATGLNNPISITYTGGSAYGDNLYVACTSSSTVVKIDMNGNKTNFFSVSNTVESIEFDNTGRYGSKLYVGTSGFDRIYAVSPTGSGTVFSNDFYNLPGSIQSLAFANSTEYDYGMYTGTWYPDYPSKSGVFSLSTTGSSQRICNELADLVVGFCMDFDDTGNFGGNLFAKIVEDYSTTNRHSGIYRILPDGSASLFISTTNTLTPFAFGQDGAMYMYDSTSNYSAIYRITPVPEPTTILLLGIGLLGLRRRK